MVFSYLVIPACIAILMASSMKVRLLLGWLIGWLGSALGLVSSYVWDFPTGPAIVVVLGMMLILSWLITMLRASNRKPEPRGESSGGS